MKQKKRGLDVGFVLLWILSAALTLAFWGVIVWGIIKLVNHFTG